MGSSIQKVALVNVTVAMFKPAPFFQKRLVVFKPRFWVDWSGHIGNVEGESLVLV